MRPRRSRRVCVAQAPDNAPPCDFRYAQTAHFARFFLWGADRLAVGASRLCVKREPAQLPNFG